MGKGTRAVIFSIEAPLHVSSVQVVDPVTGYVYDNWWPCVTTYRDIAFIHFYVYKNNLSTLKTMFTAGNHVRLDISIWKMGPTSGSQEE